MKRKLCLILALLVAAALCFAYTIVVTYSESYSSENDDGTYETDDGGSVDLEGDDPNDSSSYTSRSESMPSRTRSATINVPGNYPASEAELQEAIQEQFNADTAALASAANAAGQATADINAVKLTSALLITDNSVRNLNVSNIEINPPRAGDPVNVANGRFEISETDLELNTGLNSYAISRSMTGDAVTSGNLGALWYSSLDSRVILGVKPNAETERDTVYAACQSLREGREQATRLLAEMRLLHSRGLAESERLLQLFADQLEILRNCGYSQSAEISRAISDTEACQRAAAARTQWFTWNCATQINLAESRLAIIGTMLRLADAALAVSERELEHARLNSAVNAAALDGTGFETYRDCGNDALVIYDGNGVFRTYRLTAPIDYNAAETRYPNGSQAVCTVPGDTNLVLLRADGSVRVEDADGLVTIYGRDGRLRRQENRSGDGIEYQYTDGILTGIRYRDRVIASFERDSGGKISVITDALGGRTVYSYDGETLSAVRDSDGDSIGYRYEGRRLAETVKGDLSSVRYYYALAGADGRRLTTSTVDEMGNTETFSYNPLTRVTAHTGYGGERTIYRLNGQWQLQGRNTADGAEELYEYDSEGRLSARTINGQRVSYQYNDRGLLLSERHSDGSANRIERNARGDMISFTDRDGVTVRWTVDGDGNRLSEQRGGKPVYTATYDSSGRPLCKRLSSGAALSWQWDSDGFLSSRTLTDRDGSVYTERFTWDALGRPLTRENAAAENTIWTYAPRTVTVKEANGLETVWTRDSRKDLVSVRRTDTLTGEVRATSYRYDRRHKLIAVTDDYGTHTTHSWNEAGQLTGTAQGPWQTQWDYDGAGRPVSETRSLTGGDSSTTTIDYRRLTAGREERRTDALGNPWISFYNDENRPVQTLNPAGETETFASSAAGRPVALTATTGGLLRWQYDSAGDGSGSTRDGAEAETTEYDSAGNLVRAVDRAGTQTRYRYDGRNLLVAAEKAGALWLYRYDSAGRMTRAENRADGQWKAWSWSEGGRAVEECAGGLYYTSYRLNAFGEIVAVTDGTGITREYLRNKRGQIEREIDGYGNESAYQYNELGLLSRSVAADGTQIDYRYNQLGQEILAADAAGPLRQTWYDAVGRVLRQKTRGGLDRRYRYDAAGRLAAEGIGELETDSVTYRYEDAGRRIIRTDARGNQSVYTSDQWGRLTSETNRLGARSECVYDALDRPARLCDFAGQRAAIQYDSAQNRRTTDFSSGERITEVLNAEGAVNYAAVNSDGALSYRYDAGGRIIEQGDSAAGVTVRFRYDRAGRRILASGADREIAYRWGKNGELREIEDIKTRLAVSFDYDRAGRETERRFGNGVRLLTSYDSAGRVILIREAGPTALLRAEGYVYDGSGRRSHSVDENGRVTVYRYDAAARLAIVYYPAQSGNGGGGDGSGGSGSAEWYDFNRAEHAALSALLERMGSGRSGLLGASAPMFAERFSYDANGNRISRFRAGEMTLYEYDAEDRLIRAGDVSFRYDPNGNLVEEKSLRYLAEYRYTARNRIESAIYTDHVALTRARTTYRYDAFGRRTLSADDGAAPVRTLYDTFSFDILTEGPVFGDSTLTGSSLSGSPAGPAPVTGGRYRAPGAEAADRYSTTDEGGYTLRSDRGTQTRSPLYAGGSEMATHTSSGERLYYGTDLLGSVRSLTDASGRPVSRADWDCFGQPLPSLATPASPPAVPALVSALVSVPGFRGKVQDPTTALHNYGYRDYSPATARWTTVDPLHDGPNWYTYAENDPVNLVDWWGLDSVANLIYTKDNETITLNVYNDAKPQQPARRTVYQATNNPQPMNTPRATTIPSNENYYPQTYPEGTWNVVSVSHPNNNTYGQTKINTNAGQTVPTYTNIDGRWIPTGTTWDTGYQIHGGGYSAEPQGKNNINDNTYGCIRMENTAVNELGRLVDDLLTQDTRVTLTVQATEEQKRRKNR